MLPDQGSNPPQILNFKMLSLKPLQSSKICKYKNEDLAYFSLCVLREMGSHSLKLSFFTSLKGDSIAHLLYFWISCFVKYFEMSKMACICWELIITGLCTVVVTSENSGRPRVIDCSTAEAGKVGSNKVPHALQAQWCFSIMYAV